MRVDGGNVFTRVCTSNVHHLFAGVGIQLLEDRANLRLLANGARHQNLARSIVRSEGEFRANALQHLHDRELASPRLTG